MRSMFASFFSMFASLFTAGRTAAETLDIMASVGKEMAMTLQEEQRAEALEKRIATQARLAKIKEKHKVIDLEAA